MRLKNKERERERNRYSFFPKRQGGGKVGLNSGTLGGRHHNPLRMQGRCGYTVGTVSAKNHVAVLSCVDLKSSLRSDTCLLLAMGCFGYDLAICIKS